MAIDDSKLDYASTWEIDKIIDYQDSSTNPSLSVSLSGGANTTLTIPHAYGARKQVIAQYKPSTQSYWYEAGTNLQDTPAQLVSMQPWVGSTDIQFYVRNDHAGSVTVELRYWALADGD